ncbi:HAD family hydrolase [Pseudooceanicola nanhaiensis]|uniref:HAD family hydrolase n=1 Tax=Pseudooceanicola nanhaiensis TaxID=375761 RepID=UPI001CD29FFF|nr:HAD family phosphatase [Pseudooceanicola nanhaiensis]MCA0921658.1 HAD family phosphatase [Pseudooceanicola nanhaiensis]
MVSALLFDLDGTLLHSDPLHRRVFAEILAPSGRVVDDAFYAAHIHGRHNLETFAALLPGEDAAWWDVEKEARFRRLLAQEGATPLPGLTTLLDRAAAAGLPVAVATNAAQENAEAMLEAIGLRARFEVVVCADQVAAPKPAPDVYLTAARRLGADPARALAFEDSPSGLAAARAAGCTVVGLATGLSPETLRAKGATHVITDYTDPGLDVLLGITRGAHA